MRRALHAVLVLVAALPWLAGVLAFGLATLCVLAADRLWPGATHGNCWSFAGPRWVRHGGYLLVRLADGVPMLHAAIVHRLPADGVQLEQFMPARRRRGWRGVLSAFYFRGAISRDEKPHPSSWADL
jgi:hypothetical protein